VIPQDNPELNLTRKLTINSKMAFSQSLYESIAPSASNSVYKAYRDVAMPGLLLAAKIIAENIVSPSSTSGCPDPVSNL
jgi:hypothetical protein